METRPKRVCLIGPMAPPSHGMSLQLQELHRRLKTEGVEVTTLPTNQDAPYCLRHFQNIPGIRTLIRFAQYQISLLRSVPNHDISYQFVCCGLYVFLHTLPLLVLSKVINKQVVLSYHSGTAEEFLSKWGWFLIPFFRKATLVVVPSTFLQNVFEKAGLPTEYFRMLSLMNSFNTRNVLSSARGFWSLANSKKSTTLK